MMDEPIAVRRQYLNLPPSAFDVIIIFIGPATGIENINPAKNPIKTKLIKAIVIIFL